jgi:hypothetical protein
VPYGVEEHVRVRLRSVIRQHLARERGGGEGGGEGAKGRRGEGAKVGEKEGEWGRTGGGR